MTLRRGVGSPQSSVSSSAKPSTIRGPSPLEAGPVLVAVGGQHAVYPHGRGRLGVVGRVAEVDHVLRAHAEVGQVPTGPVFLAPGMDVVAAARLAEAAVEPVVGEGVGEQRAFVGREHRVRQAGGGETGEERLGVVVQATFRLPFLVGGHEADGHRAEGGLVGREADGLVEP